MKILYAVLLGAFLSSCAQTPTPAPVAKLKDGELAFAADYKSWPVFLKDVQRLDAKQVRDIYINTIGAKAVAGKAFANGTVTVMELYKAKENADGTPSKGADGKMEKGALLKVFMMGKGEGWGESAPAGMKNGDWIYSAYFADGNPAPDPIVACRACHFPLGEVKDFVHRYDEYFQARKS
jgi:hemoglobin